MKMLPTLSLLILLLTAVGASFPTDESEDQHPNRPLPNNAVVKANDQAKADSLAIRQAALDYIESQHHMRPEQFERSAHPRMVKRTFWVHEKTQKEYLGETFRDAMILLAETYNQDGNKFPANPQKEVIILDIFDQTASVKLIADDWIDYMHLVKLNGKWQIVNVLWQFKDVTKH